MDEGILYQRLHRWKYRLAEAYEIDISITGRTLVSSGEYIRLDAGHLCIKKGYAWDGPSGPTYDSANFMRGSLVHDCLYQLLREGLLAQGYRKLADDILRQHCLEDGMSRARARMVWWGVRTFGAKAARPALPVPEFRAP
jgi:hypothetical protein